MLNREITSTTKGKGFKCFYIINKIIYIKHSQNTIRRIYFLVTKNYTQSFSMCFRYLLLTIILVPKHLHQEATFVSQKTTCIT